MRTFPGKVREIRIDLMGQAAAWIICPKQAIPPPGRYLWASHPGAILGAPLFLERALEDGFLAAPPVPLSWEPGDRLTLRGPLGRGFKLPLSTRRLALASFVPGAARLLPLAGQAIQIGAEAALYCDFPLPGLPAALEASPLSDLPEALDWADYLALDLSLKQLPLLREYLGGDTRNLAIPPGQALLSADIPCGGTAECDVCAIKTRRGWKLICEDGPVFELGEVWDGTV